MPSFEVTFEVFCAKCGAGLCHQTGTRVSRTRGEPQITVEPCQNCLDTAHSEGYKEGKSDGYEDGQREGYDKGFSDGQESVEG